MSTSKSSTAQLGNLGEAHVILELAKLGLYATRVRGCNFDILVQNGKRIEVKSSKVKILKVPSGRKELAYPVYGWATGVKSLTSYKHGRQYYAGYERTPAYSDFFVFIGFTNDNQPERFYIVPTEEARKGGRLGIKVFLERSDPLAAFRDNWKALL